MDRLVRTVEVQPVEPRVGNHPLGNLQHILILDNEVRHGTEPIADQIAETITLMPGMLIPLRIDATRDLTRQLRRTKAIYLR